ncbi:MAG TPA: cation diffusion facilitator family transporter [Acidimicrobiia bacterium]|nr:cation diffusion facilitator family transporter [Acidimicrobiia bacterium]
MSSEPSHLPSTRAGTRYKRRLVWVFGLVLGFMVAEVVAGVFTNSLALLSDAGHMATDALGLGMALAAIVAADRVGHTGQRTYGLYRLEILAALANAVLLFAVAGFVLYEAFQRFQEPPEILSGPMLAVAVLGLGVNLLGWRLLRDGAEQSINVEGAYLEVIADLVGSVGVVVAALIILFTSWTYADPLFGAAIGLFILPRAWKLGKRAVRILVQAAPEGLDLAQLRQRLELIEDVIDVHDLHVWTLTSDMEVASVHLMTSTNADTQKILSLAQNVLRDEYKVGHATLQVEPETQEGCAELTW